MMISEIIASPLYSGFAAGLEDRAQGEEDSVPQIRPTQILLNGEIDLSDAYGIRVQDISKRNYIQYGEVLFNNTNSTDLVGKSAVFASHFSAVCSNHVTRLRLKEGVEPEFVELVLNWLQQRRYFARLCTNFNNQAGVNIETLSTVRIPFPPAPQRRRLVAGMRSARAERRVKLAEADALLASLDDFVLDALGIAQTEDPRRAFAVRRGDMTGLQLSPSRYIPELQLFLNGLRSHPAVSRPLGTYVDINPQIDLSEVDGQEIVGFIPMKAVSDGATGDYTFEERPLDEVRKGYTPFEDGDILWAKITPCMQNGKSCIVEGLPNGTGFGSTEFHVLRVREQGILTEFVKEFISQRKLRQVATYAFTGSAGQQRVPSEFLVSLPFPKIRESLQVEIVEEIAETRAKARRLLAEAEAGWQEAKRWFENQLLG